MVVPDSSSPHGLKLMIKDYPYDVNGLEIWFVIKTWVTEYCTFYNPSNEAVKQDAELQSWCSEIKNKGHDDLKTQLWWPKMNTTADLIRTCTIPIRRLPHQQTNGQPLVHVGTGHRRVQRT
ncbi:hypothetical protein V6N11_029622 [Hibiscus sabdariffa]|uniref:Lipoxygenase domain-containing protein n=1 Tax=Hibiscus sabdariffa TaxID=183260 RepID=A0ABR2P7A5_9ROSI